MLPKANIIIVKGNLLYTSSPDGLSGLSFRIVSLGEFLKLGSDQTPLVNAARFKLVDDLAVLPVPDGDAVVGVSSDEPRVRGVELDLHDLIARRAERPEAEHLVACGDVVVADER
jgi:hypothetical protein